MPHWQFFSLLHAKIKHGNETIVSGKNRFGTQTTVATSFSVAWNETDAALPSATWGWEHYVRPQQKGGFHNSNNHLTCRNACAFSSHLDWIAAAGVSNEALFNCIEFYSFLLLASTDLFSEVYVSWMVCNPTLWFLCVWFGKQLLIYSWGVFY